MPVLLEIEFRDEQVEALLQNIERKFQNLKPALSVIGEIVRTSVERNFEVGGRPGKWKEPAPATIEQRVKKKKWPGQVLVQSARLKKSINFDVEKDKVTIGSNIRYSALHQFGAKRGEFGTISSQVKTHFRKLSKGKAGDGEKKVKVKGHTRKQKIPWGDIPARPFLEIQDEDWKEMTRAIEEHFLKV